MAELPSQARVVIIGGGAVGASCLYHLAKAGWGDCLLLEKNELTSGSTWHAAGNVPTFSASWAVMNMQRYSTELYRRLGDEVDYPMNYNVTGALRLSHSKAYVFWISAAVEAYCSRPFGNSAPMPMGSNGLNSQSMKQQGHMSKWAT